MRTFANQQSIKNAALDLCQADSTHITSWRDIGIPLSLIHVEHSLFSEIKNHNEAANWRSSFLDAIPVGADLEKAGVWRQLALFVLADIDHGLINCAYDTAQYNAIHMVIQLFQDDCKKSDVWKAAFEQAKAEENKVYCGMRIEQLSDARLTAGVSASVTAALFAWAFYKKSAAALAISEGAWCWHRRNYAKHLAFAIRGLPVCNGIPPVDLGPSSYSAIRWNEIGEQAVEMGRGAQKAYFKCVSERLLLLLQYSRHNDESFFD